MGDKISLVQNFTINKSKTQDCDHNIIDIKR